jgi:hypothetical protein
MAYCLTPAIGTSHSLSDLHGRTLSRTVSLDSSTSLKRSVQIGLGRTRLTDNRQVQIMFLHSIKLCMPWSPSRMQSTTLKNFKSFLGKRQDFFFVTSLYRTPIFLENIYFPCVVVIKRYIPVIDIFLDADVFVLVLFLRSL